MVLGTMLALKSHRWNPGCCDHCLTPGPILHLSPRSMCGGRRGEGPHTWGGAHGGEGHLPHLSRACLPATTSFISCPSLGLTPPEPIKSYTLAFGRPEPASQPFLCSLPLKAPVQVLAVPLSGALPPLLPVDTGRARLSFLPYTGELPTHLTGRTYHLPFRPQAHLTRSTSKVSLGVRAASGLALLETAASGEHREGHRQVRDIPGEKHPVSGQ